MKLLHRQILFLFVSIGLTFPSFCQERTWRDNSGTFEVQAEYLGLIDDKVVLKKQNGNVIRVPLSKLSLADQEYLEQLSQQATEQPESDEGEATSETSDPSFPTETPANPPGTSDPVDPTEADSNLKSTARTSTKAPPIEVPVINVTDAQVEALPQSLREIATVLHSGTDSAAIRIALTELADNWPGDNATILDLVRKTTFCKEKFCRKKSLTLLCKHDLTNSFPFILARMDDSSFENRWAAMEYIERSSDPRALKPLVDRFIGPDRAKISLALMTYGSQAEPYLHEYLKHGRADVRMETSLLLGKMGTEASIPKLEEIAENDSNPVVALQAKSAIQRINDRLAESKKSGS